MERTRGSDQCRLGQSRKVSAKSGRLELFYFCEVDLWLHQQNDRLAVVLGVYFGPSIVVRNPLWCWVTVAILWAGVYLFLL